MHRSYRSSPLRVASLPTEEMPSSLHLVRLKLTAKTGYRKRYAAYMLQIGTSEDQVTNN